MIFSTIAFILATLAAVAGFNISKRFVRDRLRYVDGVHKSLTPVLAGIGAGLIAWIVTGLLPIVGIGTAIAFALSVAAGVAAGSREVKSGTYPSITSGG